MMQVSEGAEPRENILHCSERAKPRPSRRPFAGRQSLKCNQSECAAHGGVFLFQGPDTCEICAFIRWNQ